jgi:hypothetical protein
MFRGGLQDRETEARWEQRFIARHSAHIDVEAPGLPAIRILSKVTRGGDRALPSQPARRSALSSTADGHVVLR